MTVPADVLAKAQTFIEQARWQHSWTVPGRFHPHDYATREWCADQGLEAKFEWLVLAIREHGYDDTFGKRTFRYLDVEVDDVPWRVWTMRDPGERLEAWLSETRIINREDLVRKAERAERNAAKREAQMRLEGVR